MKNSLSPFSYFTFCLIYLSISGCSKKNNFIYDEGMVWNTVFHITYAGSENLRDSIRFILDETGKELSVFDPSSLVTKVNQEISTPVTPGFEKVYMMSKKVNRISRGAFDPTISPLITAWGFGPGHAPTSDTLRIDSLLKITGLEKTQLKNHNLIKDDKNIQFNFSAIAKGYGCDRVAEMLRRNGVTDYLVEIGGEIAAGGKSPKGTHWKVSVDRPVESEKISHESQLIVELSDCGMATSGNYRNFHTEGNLRFGHTISPKTGRPVKTDILSATVIAADAMEADALATAFMVAGSVNALEIADSLGIAVMFICPDKVITTPEFEKFIIH